MVGIARRKVICLVSFVLTISRLFVFKLDSRISTPPRRYPERRLPTFFKEVSFPCRDTLPPFARTVLMLVALMHKVCPCVRHDCALERGAPIHANAFILALALNEACATLRSPVDGTHVHARALARIDTEMILHRKLL